MDTIDTARTFLDDNPDIEVLEAFVIAVNGVPRGKWIPRERALDVLSEGMAMPRSGYAIGPVRPPNSREGRWHTGQTQVLSISELQDFEDVFHGIASAARAQGIPADTTLRENGPGQYEIILNHVPDALKAADYAVLLKR